MISLRDVVAYLLERMGCIHPYRISRALVLINWKALELTGKPVCKFKVEGFRLGFYIPELASIIDKEACFKRNEERKCVEYVCKHPSLPADIEELIDTIIRDVKKMPDNELNRRVINDPRYEELLGKGGFL